MQQTRRTHTQPMIYLKPTPLSPEEQKRLHSAKRIVRMPEHDYMAMPDEGMWAPKTQYWLQNLADGAVVEAEPPADRLAPPALPAQPDGSGPVSGPPPRRGSRTVN